MSDPVAVRPPTGQRTLPVPPAWRIVVLVAAAICSVIVVVNVFVAAHRILGWAIAAALVAMLLAPVIAWLDRAVPRPLAIASTFIVVVLIGVGVAWLYSASLLAEVESLQEDGAALAEQIEQRDDRIGDIAQEISLVDQVTELTARIDERSGSGDDVIRSAALSAPAYFVSMILTIFLLIFGPRMVDGAIGQLPHGHRRRARAALDAATSQTQLQVWAAIAQAAVSGLALWCVATALDVPAAALLALLGAVLSMLPYLGVVVGWLPCAVLAIGTASGVGVALVVAVAAGLQAIEIVWWRRRVDQRSLHVGPVVPIVVGVLGYAVYGIGGALYGCVLAVLALALVDALSSAGAASSVDVPTPLDEPEHASTSG